MMAKKDPKSKKKSTNEHADLSALDTAVSELARQTEALLGKTGEKVKPALSKKKPSINSRARHFDIIHSGDVTKKSAVLKAAPQKSKLLEDTQNTESTPMAEKLLEPGDEPAATIVSSHKTGSLSTTSSSLAADEDVTLTSEKDAKPAASKREEPKAVEKEVDKEIENEKNDSSTESVDNENVSAEPTDSTEHQNGDQDEVSQDAEHKTPNPDQADATSISTGPASTLRPATDATQNIRLHSDNFDDDLSLNTEEAEEKTDIFDTDEYHPTLHDWSKLEHKSKTPLIVLLVLTIVFAVGVYAVLNGVSLSL